MSHVTPSRSGHITPDPITGPRFAGGGHWTPEEQRACFDHVHPKWSSTIKRGGKVTFPLYAGERVYMVPFLKHGDEVLLPFKLARWLPTVEAMMAGVQTAAKCYLMIDQSEVKVGETHRRAGAHIDGLWSERGGGTVEPDWESKERFEGELILLASDVAGCVAYVGDYDLGDIKPGGDCSGMDLSKLRRVALKPGYTYIATAATIHESVPVEEACKRTLVRINVPRS